MFGFVLVVLFICGVTTTMVTFPMIIYYGMMLSIDLVEQGQIIVEEGELVIVNENEVDEMAMEMVEERFMASALQLSVAGSTLGVLGAWLFFKVRGRKFWRYLRIRKTSLSNIVVALFLGAGTSMFLTGLITILGLDKILPTESTDMLIEGQSFVVVLIAVGIIVPFVEEIIFRGVIFNRFREDLKLVPAIILQAVIFGLMHGNILQSSYCILVGILLALVYAWADSLLIPVFVHMGINLTSPFLGALAECPSVSLILMGLMLLVAGILYYKKEQLKLAAA